MDILSYKLGKKSGGSGQDWSELGYSTPPQSLNDAYEIAQRIKNDWQSDSRLSDIGRDVIICPLVDTSSKTSFYYFAANCYSLLEVPLLDTSNVTTMSNAFYGAQGLRTIPVFDVSKATQMASMFQGCANLTNESLNNILKMCINATAYTGTKTLSTLGFNNTHQPKTKIQALPSYQDFLDAGWTIGY